MATDQNQYLGNPLLKKANVSVEFGAVLKE
jgi:hypothetical protein